MGFLNDCESLIFTMYAFVFLCLGRLLKSNLLTYTHVYAVKNTQANVVELKVMEQVPLSSDERLKV